MINPSKEQVQFVIDKFESIKHLATADGHLCMKELAVKSLSYDPGTIHCHGGWYAVANLDRISAEYIGYHDGAKLMASDLGGEIDDDLTLWAESNPDIWGNKFGLHIFSDVVAFKSKFNIFNFLFRRNKIRKEAKSLQDIIDHWKEVKGRLK